MPEPFPSDPFNLQRFVEAQAPVLAAVEAELRAGRKASHWMWFIFPQLVGLGRSGMARFYAITGLEEARAYLAHPVLGQRLIHCLGLVNAIEGRSAHEIFGSPDDLKFRSSVTLFREAVPKTAIFQAALERYFGGEPDPATLALL